ncbi:formate hydrogenlyase [Accumulibacter sp.]|uniref:formate hydrogenlyase n=1 Tax=Accumulibacter sp. TaxID=2053492 RepID=UPI002B8C5E86|nr:formate hydrogenlyase [Accumulibacter sp.]HPU81370.1 formate hydrogenlyase [Accumulibacter sp.]
MTELVGQLINLLAAILLMLSFAMISQRRILSLIHLFTAQGATLVAATVLVGYATQQPHLYISAGITLLLKVIVIPLLLYRVITRLDVRWDVETLINIPMTMIIGIALVIFAFNLALPISKLSVSLARGTLGIALACVLLSFMMMITRSKAVPQVIGFLSMENGLFFAATSATYGMPMVVELGIALDVLVGILILGVFLFHIREQFDSLDISHLEKLKED